jgi:uncharacterized integral membrane protein
MSWLEEFEEELKARHVRPAVRERLVTELADHIACEQEASPPAAATQLGAPREIAGQCAEELATHDARRGAVGAFLALAATGVVFLVQQATLGRTGYPGFDHGYSTPLALIAILAFVVGSQVALVCGVLAAWRAVRRGGVPVLPAAEIALLRRRTTIGLGAGLVTTTGLLLYVVNFIGVLPVWWLSLCGTLAAGATVALAAALRTLRQGASTLALAEGPAGDLYDDIPPLRALRPHPLALWALATLLVGGIVTVGAWHAEHSLVEGFERGGFEVLALSAGFALFGRAIGARR